MWFYSFHDKGNFGVGGILNCFGKRRIQEFFYFLPFLCYKAKYFLSFQTFFLREREEWERQDEIGEGAAHTFKMCSLIRGGSRYEEGIKGSKNPGLLHGLQSCSLNIYKKATF